MSGLNEDWFGSSISPCLLLWFPITTLHFLRYATLRDGNRIILNEMGYTVQIRAMARLGSWTEEPGAGCVIYFL